MRVCARYSSMRLKAGGTRPAICRRRQRHERDRSSSPPRDRSLRADFPILSQTVRGKPLVFLDSAASAMKPRVVIDAMCNAMETQYANIHRGAQLDE